MVKQVRSKKRIPKSDVQTQKTTSATLVIAIYAFIALHFLFLFVFPDWYSSFFFHRTWGFHFIAFFPVPILFMSYAAAILVSHPTVAQRIVQLWEFTIWRALTKLLKFRKIILYGVFSIASFFPFYFFRVKYGLLGDNFLRIQDVATGKIIPNEPGTIHFYKFLADALNASFGLQVLDSVVLFNCLSGSAYVFLTFYLAEALGKNSLQKGMYVVGLLSVGIIQYFFGYIELYNFVMLLVLSALWTGILSIQNRCNILIPLILISIAFYAHFMIATFLPSFAYLFYRKVFCRWSIFRNPKFIAAEVIALTPVMVIIYNKFVRGNILIYTPNEMYSYAMLTWSHLWEYINGQILAAPAAFPILLLLLLPIYLIHKKRIDLTGQFLGIAAVFTTLNSFMFNAVRGAADWDILCVAGFPITLFALYLLFQANNISFIRKNLKYICIIFIVFSALNTPPWIIVNATDLSIQRKIVITENDPAEYYANDTHPPAMIFAIEFETNGMEKEAEYWYREAIRRHPNDPRNYYNCANFLHTQKRSKEAPEIITLLLQKFPGYPMQYRLAYRIFSSMGETTQAYSALEKLIELSALDPENVARYYTQQDLIVIRAELITYYIKSKKFPEARELVKKLVDINPELRLGDMTVVELLAELDNQLKTNN